MASPIYVWSVDGTVVTGDVARYADHFVHGEMGDAEVSGLYEVVADQDGCPCLVWAGIDLAHLVGGV